MGLEIRTTIRRRRVRPVGVKDVTVSPTDAELLESLLKASVKEPDSLFIIEGPQDERNQDLLTVRAWAYSREPRVMIKEYHPKELPSDCTYYRMYFIKNEGESCLS